MTRPTLEGSRPLPPLKAAGEPHRSNGHAPKRKTAATANRFQTYNQFYDIALREVTRDCGFVAGHVWNGLWRDTDHRTGKATTSRRSLADRIGCSLGGVKKALRLLERDGWITIVRRGNKTIGPSTYVANPKPEATK